MKATLRLTGLPIHSTALIAPAASLWLDLPGAVHLWRADGRLRHVDRPPGGAGPLSCRRS
jgi:hypothetical protein